MTPCPADPARDCEFRSIGEFVDQSGKVGAVEVARCVNCGHGISLPPIPDPAFLYEDRQSQDFQPDSRGLAHRIKDIAFRRDAKRLLETVGPCSGQILDFGCGSGQFTRVLGEVHGIDKVTGADMHTEPPLELRNRPYAGPAEQAELKQRFDVVLAMQVLEHDDDANKLLSQISGFARPGGKVVIEVPNIRCPWNLIFGKYWDAWYIPYHRQHYSRASLVSTLEKGGLKVVAVQPVSIPTMGRTFANMFGQKNSLGWLLLGAAAHPLQVLVEKLAGQPTAWRVVTVK